MKPRTFLHATVMPLRVSQGLLGWNIEEKMATRRPGTLYRQLLTPLQIGHPRYGPATTESPPQKLSRRLRMEFKCAHRSAEDLHTFRTPHRWPKILHPFWHFAYFVPRSCFANMQTNPCHVVQLLREPGSGRHVHVIERKRKSLRLPADAPGPERKRRAA